MPILMNTSAKNDVPVKKITYFPEIFHFISFLHPTLITMYKISTFTLLLLLFLNNNLFSKSFWKTAEESNFRSSSMERLIIPNVYKTMSLDINALKDYLQDAPEQQSDDVSRTSYFLELPTPDGKMEQFQIWKSPVMHPDLAARYPMIQTYGGRSMDDPTASVRFDITSHGFHAMVLAAGRSVFIDPYARQETKHYIVYYKKDFTSDKNFHCAFDEEEHGAGRDLELDRTELVPHKKEKEEANRMATYCSESVTLRTYRSAVACTGEFGQFHGGTVPDALSAIVTTMNRVNSVYERDLAIRLELIANNDDVVFVNPLTDPFQGNSNATVLLGESIVQLEAFIGSANFDLGHTVSTGAGGVAFLGVICGTQKAGGITGTNNPIGDPFDIDYVSHEMGHQFGGRHTFNGSQGSCGGNGGSSTAFEPGSGSTIQAYAGICGSQNLQPNSDPYFHVESLDEMGAYSRAGTGDDCPAKTDALNTTPQILSATSGFTIPAFTPFELTATASDPDGDELTYCWEQYDLGASNTVDDPNAADGPIFRSFNPTMNPTRTFPRLSDLVQNTTVYGEALPQVSRALKFRLTVRDNGTNSDNVGGICFDDFAISVDGNSGPLLVNSPNGAEVWDGGTQETVTWDVANTDQAPVNASEVDILLSTDGGFTYPTLLADNVPNTGMATITVPSINARGVTMTTTTARIKVKAADNIFFDITNEDFEIQGAALPIEWLSVHATPQQTSIKLDWSTAVEVNNSGFEIQRSADDDHHFQKIAWMNAEKGGQGASYQWIDEDVISNTTYYYRLKQVDVNEKTNFSKIVSARLDSSDEEWDVILSPNPAQDKMNVQVLGLNNKALTFQLFEMNGRLVQTYMTTETLDLTAIPAGIYILKIWNGEQQLVKRLVKE